MKQQNVKRLPAKFNRYLIFGMWLEEQVKVLSNETEIAKNGDGSEIGDLFRINSTTEEQISFYSKFHDEYKLFSKNFTQKTKRIRKMKKTQVDSIVCEDNESKIEDNMDYLWDMDSDYDIIVKEIV